MKLSTKVVHAGMPPEETSGAVIPPIFQTSTFVQSEPGVHKGWDYSRAGNPTRDLYETALSAIEGTDHAISFSSGLAAEQAIIQGLLEPGDEVIVCDDIYGGSGRLFRTLFAKYGIIFHFVDMQNSEEVKQHVTPKTKMLWIETPTNPTMKLIDIEHTASLCPNAVVVVDNTFASPLFQNPIKHGADIIVHSTTKYIGGHSDVIGGAVMTSHSEYAEKIRYVQFAAGAVPSPFESYLLHRSIKTLAIRMERHQENARAVHEYLSSHNKVKAVHFPSGGIYEKQMTGVSGMISFNYNGSYDEVTGFLKKLRVFTLAESLGGVESLVNHPEKMTHASVPEPLRKKLGIDASLIRLSVGIEDIGDIIDDLKAALS